MWIQFFVLVPSVGSGNVFPLWKTAPPPMRGRMMLVSWKLPCARCMVFVSCKTSLCGLWRGLNGRQWDNAFCLLRLCSATVLHRLVHILCWSLQRETLWRTTCVALAESCCFHGHVPLGQSLAESFCCCWCVLLLLLCCLTRLLVSWWLSLVNPKEPISPYQQEVVGLER